mmetsp:Transcript_3562/g.9276  ORF Transcript_3562/g.9276 Transcript_3562/m.9276 type:complete len:323 (+) Transcript_3562:711-1679(+)
MLPVAAAGRLSRARTCSSGSGPARDRRRITGCVHGASSQSTCAWRTETSTSSAPPSHTVQLSVSPFATSETISASARPPPGPRKSARSARAEAAGESDASTRASTELTDTSAAHSGCRCTRAAVLSVRIGEASSCRSASRERCRRPLSEKAAPPSEPSRRRLIDQGPCVETVRCRQRATPIDRSSATMLCPEAPSASACATAPGLSSAYEAHAGAPSAREGKSAEDASWSKPERGSALAGCPSPPSAVETSSSRGRASGSSHAYSTETKGRRRSHRCWLSAAPRSRCLKRSSYGVLLHSWKGAAPGCCGERTSAVVAKEARE